MILGRCNFLSRVWYMSELSKEHTAAITNLQQCAFLSIPAQRTNRIGHKSSTFPNFSANRASTSGAKSKSNKTNRLALEKSPYLLQHATNPVDWYPWCDEALERAKKEDELIFLSVGYSTCHWCHVMEKESFKNKEIAKVMNDNFVNIKVDREERPDIDRIYMTFVQEWIGHCAWPMSVFLTPDLKPIGGGTYFPPWDSFGQTGFKTILLKISQNWKQVKSKLVEWGCINLETLQNISEIPLTSKTDEMPSLETGIICVQQLTSEFDPTFDGFDSSYIMQAPKFPQPVNFNLLIHMYARQPTGELAKHCLHMCTYTLTKMSYSGIHDHVGQGFSRSATCGEWHVRHFEKMLYDQGQLMQSYADAYVATKETLYAEIIDDIATYVIRDLRHKEGGFYSAEDGDSYPTHNATVKKEGAYYVWTHAEITSLLNKEISGKDMKYSDVFCFHFNVKESGNVKKYQDPHGELTGKNMLMVYDGIERTAKQFNLSVQETKKYLKEACSILYEARCVRPRPHLDDKILTAWNGLMMSGLARGGSAVGNKEYIKYARDIAKFVERYLFDGKRNVLLRSCYRGYRDVITQTSVPISGFLDDYAFIVKGLLDLYEATLEERWLEFAEKIHDIQDSLFWDDSNGGYFSTMSDDPCIILRLKEVHDGAEPSGNSVAAENLLRLADYLGRGELKDRAKLLFGAFRQLLTQRPVALPQMVSALVRYHDGATQIYVAGKRGAKDTEDLLQAMYQHLIPNRILFLVDQDETNGLLFRKNENLKNMRPVDGKAAAYVCRHHTCSLPVTSAEQLASLLEEERQENS